MISLRVTIGEWANELLFFAFEWEQELTYGVRYSTEEYPEIHAAVGKLLDAGDNIDRYVEYDTEQLELVDATFGKRATITYAIPVELDDEALLRDYGY